MAQYRDLLAEDTVSAPPERVWALLSDLGRMREWSPETARVIPLKRGGLRPNQWYLGLNRRGLVVWPTRSVLVEATPLRGLVWETRTSGARWIWELSPDGDGTRVTHRRTVRPAGPPLIARAFGRAFLGGVDEFADELERDMATTLAGLKAAAEA